MKKFALFVFNGDPMCFIHVLLNALDMKAKGHEAQIILEGASVKLVSELGSPGFALTGLWNKCLAAGLVAGVCKGCAAKLGTLEAAKERELALLDDMSGHPSMAAYRDQAHPREGTEWIVSYAYNANETNLPRVLLVGDSICNGYSGDVRKEFFALMDPLERDLHWNDTYHFKGDAKKMQAQAIGACVSAALEK